MRQFTCKNPFFHFSKALYLREKTLIINIYILDKGGWTFDTDSTGHSANKYFRIAEKWTFDGAYWQKPNVQCWALVNRPGDSLFTVLHSKSLGEWRIYVSSFQPDDFPWVRYPVTTHNRHFRPGREAWWKIHWMGKCSHRAAACFQHCLRRTCVLHRFWCNSEQK